MSGVNKVFTDFKGRRIAFIKAFTSDFDDLFALCDPDDANLMLYGYPNNKWELRYPAPANEFPELPEPALGINFARDGMNTKDWLSLVAVHSDAWLLAVAYFFAGKIGLDKADRERLFDKINNLPTLIEIVMTEFKENPAESTSTSSSNNKKPNPKPKPRKKGRAKCQDTRSSRLKQALRDKLASRLKGLKLDTESHQQDSPLTMGTSEVSSSDILAGTTGEKKQKTEKSKMPPTSQSESSGSVVRVVDDCTDLASDPTMRPAGPKTFRQARPTTR